MPLGIIATVPSPAALADGTQTNKRSDNENSLRVTASSTARNGWKTKTPMRRSL
jgi:hypothetical protein